MLKNVRLANQETATVFGPIKFDEKGECRQLTAEQEKEFAHCVGFDVVVEEEKLEEVKKPVAKKPAKKDVKEEE
jgi:hypothetical protein